jgi:hypothetical protein
MIADFLTKDEALVREGCTYVMRRRRTTPYENEASRIHLLLGEMSSPRYTIADTEEVKKEYSHA